MNVKEAFKINKDKMIESWEQKKNIMLSKRKLKERKGEKGKQKEVKRGG
jgi:hypothetical protein